MVKQILIDELDGKIKFMEQVCLFNENLTSYEIIQTRSANSLIDFGKYRCLIELKKEIEDKF